MYKRARGVAGPMVGVLIAAVVLSVAACAQGTSITNRSSLSTTIPSNETLYMLDGGSGTAGAQRIVAVHPGAGTGSVVTLPAGLVTEDNQRLYVATPKGEQTTISILDAHTGATARTFSIAGNYATDSHGYGSSTLTPDGRWLALRRVGEAGSDRSTIALVDTVAGKVARTLQLAGDFDIDALSPDGTVLYLLQNLHDAQHRYYVRAYDIGVGRLLDQFIVDKSEINNPKMQGAAVARRLGSNGAVAFTLYVDPLRNTAFVHVLSLDSTGNITPFARCVDDLPASQSLDLLRTYTLVLSNDGSTLYAVNAALGVANKITIGDGGIFNAHVVASSHFAPMGSASGDYGYGGILSNGAALSADHSILYVAGARGLQLIRTIDMEPLGTYLAGHTLTSVALAASGKMLYVTDAQQGVLLVSNDGTKSEPLPVKGVQSPHGIAWVSN
ncbi:MAG: hypothetical protein ACXVDI_17155 [Ktedonobacterales bacterium]